MVIVLGIESTAHTFGVGIVKDGEVIANQRDMYTTETGGIIPMDSAKHHKEVSEEVYEKALKEAGISEEDINVVAFSQGPGLAPCLLEGMKFAKNLALKLDKPLVGVNHCVAHLEIGAQGCTPPSRSGGRRCENLCEAPKHSSKECLQEANPVMLYASGANTQIIAYAAGKYRIFGETLDIGVGNFIDNFARYAGLGFPGGPKIERLAKGGKLIELPYRVKGMDVSFSGILTNLRQKLEMSAYTQRVREPLRGSDKSSEKISTKGKAYSLSDLAYSLQETVFAMLVEVAERALAHTGKDELVLGGGVSCNSRLQEMCKIMCEERGAKFFCPDRSLLVDNGAMIAYLGEIMFKAQANVFSYRDLDKCDIMPRQRTDGVSVDWK